MGENGREPTCGTVKLNLRTATFALAGVLATLGMVPMLVLTVMAVVDPGRELNLGLWLFGLAGALLLLAALTTCGLAALGRLISARLTAHAAETQAAIERYEAQLHGEVEAYQAGVGTTLTIFQQALPKQLPPNVHPIRPNEAEFANAN